MLDGEYNRKSNDMTCREDTVSFRMKRKRSLICLTKLLMAWELRMR